MSCCPAAICLLALFAHCLAAEFCSSRGTLTCIKNVASPQKIKRVCLRKQQTVGCVTEDCEDIMDEFMRLVCAECAGHEDEMCFFDGTDCRCKNSWRVRKRKFNSEVMAYIETLDDELHERNKAK